ncbi:MAG: DUF350 domain-containing protein [Chloroflexi bacterium]|nr:DUF350 domain-containing protein [Chloroflexota bacterium]
MIDAFLDTLQAFPRGLGFVGLGIVILVLAKLARDVVTSYRIDEEVTQKNNVAVALRLSGYLVGVILVFLGALYQPPTLIAVDGFGFDRAYGEEILRVFIYSIAGIVALNLVRLLMDRLILYKFSVEKEVVQDQNVGTGAAEFGLYVATGLLIAGAIAGDGTGTELATALTALAFFGMGLALLVVFSLFYQFTTAFDIHSEIEGKNTAVGVAFGGNLIAIGLVTFKALFGDFAGWGESTVTFLTFGVLGFALLYVLRLLVDLLLLPTVKISNALAEQRNVGVAFIQSAVVISMALILFLAI